MIFESSNNYQINRLIKITTSKSSFLYLLRLQEIRMDPFAALLPQCNDSVCISFRFQLPYVITLPLFLFPDCQCFVLVAKFNRDIDQRMNISVPHKIPKDILLKEVGRYHL